jgi:hypothetical protein
MENAFMLKRWVLGRRWFFWGLGAVTVAACTAGSPSEQIVRRNLPAEQGAAAPIAATQKSTLERSGSSDKSITSQEVERELNRLEAELR